jgi:hypothetical protein
MLIYTCIAYLFLILTWIKLHFARCVSRFLGKAQSSMFTFGYITLHLLYLWCQSRWPCRLRRVFSHLVAGIAGSNSAEGIGFRLLCFLCFVYMAAFATGWSLVQRSSNCVWSKTSKRVALDPTLAVSSRKKNMFVVYTLPVLWSLKWIKPKLPPHEQ